MRRWPIIATVVVAAAVATMVALGFWQLRRADEKNALLAHYAQAQSMSAQVPWPIGLAAKQEATYRHTALSCERVLRTTAIAGRNRDGVTGWAHMADCVTQNGDRTSVIMGWSPDPALHSWAGGDVHGIFLMSGQYGSRLIADPPIAGLVANALPNPASVPNNHIAYAIQWFLFALAAGVIYVLALRRRLRDALPS